MINPILQAMSKSKSTNHIMNLVYSLKNGNPDAIFNQMMMSNPQFAKFVNENSGKSVEQIVQENGIDINLLQQFMK